MLAAATKTYKMKDLVVRLKNVQFQKWMNKGNSAYDTFSLLRLNKENSKLLENPAFTTWESYVVELDKANPYEAMFLVLKTYFNDEALMKMVETAKVGRIRRIATKLDAEIWRSQYKSVEDIFNLLKLKEKGRNMFEAPEFTTWMSYVKKLNSVEKNPDESVALSILKKRFDETELARMLGQSKLNASQDSETLKVISDVQTMQFKQWLAKGMNRNDVSKMLTDNNFDLTRDTKVILDYADFYRVNNPRIRDR